MDEISSANARIPIDPLFEELTCAICLDLMRDTMVTPCGHSFCGKCIYESLNLRHQCPFCKTDCVLAQLSKNLIIDSLIETINKLRQEASKDYFKALLKVPVLPSSLTQSQELAMQTKEELLSPIEKLFQQHMSKTLSGYESYYQELKKKCEASCDAIQLQLQNTLTTKQDRFEKKLKRRVEGEVPTVEEITDKHNRSVERSKKKALKSIEKLKESFDKSIQLLTESYEQYMSGFAPLPIYLNVNINVVIGCKGIRIENIILKPTDNLSDLKTKITDRMAQNNNPIFDIKPTCTFYIQHRLAVASSSSSSSSSALPATEEALERVLINDSNLPIAQFRIDPGDDIVIEGEGVVMESDRPKKCVSYKFEKGVTLDYFRCKTCNWNWVCPECSVGCHAGHSLVISVRGHQPTWACCDCAKYKKCKILNKNSKD